MENLRICKDGFMYHTISKELVTFLWNSAGDLCPEIYKLNDNGTVSPVESSQDIMEHDGLFGLVLCDITEASREIEKIAGKKTVYRAYEEIKAREINELSERLKAFGGECHFGPDYTGKYASGTDKPYIMVNTDEYGPIDAPVNYVYMGQLVDFPVVEIEYPDGNESKAVSLDDIAYGHIEFITDEIPVK